MFVRIVQELRSTCLIEFVSAAVTVTEERCRSTLEMVQTHRLPFRRALKLHREFRILVLDRGLARITAVHADEPIEHEL